MARAHRIRFAAPAALLPMLAAASALAQSPLDYAQARARAEADEASLSGAPAQSLLDAQSRLLGDGIEACATPNADTSPFVVVAELDAAGRVVRTWREGGTPLAICVQKQIAGKTLVVPPRAPFYTFFELSFTP